MGSVCEAGEPTVENKALVLFTRNRSIEDWGNHSVTEHLPGVVPDSVLKNLSSPPAPKSTEKSPLVIEDD